MDTQAHLDMDKVVELTRTQSEIEAGIIRGILAESGIDCVLVTQVPHNIYPFTVDGLAVIQIKVLDSQLEAARSLLEEHAKNPASDEDPE